MARKSNAKASNGGNATTHSKPKNSAKNVSNRLKNAMRRERLANINVDDLLKSMEHRQSVISRTRFSTPEEKELRDKFIKTAEINRKVDDLMNLYGSSMTTKEELQKLYSQVRHAVLTNRVGEQSHKWGLKWVLMR